MSTDETARTAPPPSLVRRFTNAAPEVAAWIATSADAQAIGRAVPLPDKQGAVIITRGQAPDGLADRWLSAPHFELVPAAGPDRWLLRDLGASSPTFVNGQPVTTSLVAPGDVIRAGATVLVIGAGVRADDDLGLLGWSAELGTVRDQIREAATSRWPVHITGESGAGKEVVARALHRASGRRGSFHALNVANIVPSLAESQLFGHRRGAFSGADANVVGAFEAADDGTLLLDEIGELALGLQPKLLRVVEDGQLHRLGDASPRAVDVRVVTATLRDLRQMVDAGSFRPDLYYRLVHARIEVPPLRARPLDIPVLAASFLAAAGADPTLLSDDAGPWAWASVLEPLLLYGWPGNARELRAEIDRIAAACTARGALMAREDMLSSHVLDHGRIPLSHAAASGGRSYEDLCELLERPSALQAAVNDEAGGSVRGWARIHSPTLNLSIEALRRRIRRVLSGESP